MSRLLVSSSASLTNVEATTTIATTTATTLSQSSKSEQTNESSQLVTNNDPPTEASTTPTNSNSTTTTSKSQEQKPNQIVQVSLSVQLFKPEKLYPTPSMADNLPFDVEFDLRLVGCELIQIAGRLLKLPQVRDYN